MFFSPSFSTIFTHFRICLQTKQWGDTVAGSDLRSILHRYLDNADRNLDNADPQFANLPVLCRSVLQLALPYLGKGHHIFADRFYSSLPLMKTLAEHNTHYTGTIVKNRVNLPDPRDCLSRSSYLAHEAVTSPPYTPCYLCAGVVGVGSMRFDVLELLRTSA